MPNVLRFRIAAEQVDPAEELLWFHGAQAVTLLEAADQPLLEPGPGETPLWKTVTVEALLEDSADAMALRDALSGAGILAETDPGEIRELADRDWTRAWMDRFQPMRFGESLWICPWHLEPDPAWPVVVRLDPGLAFGTGTHPTTALCLEWLDGLDLAGKSVIDYGAGSGVLAVAAALKGASSVIAIDHDPQALEATLDNARRNGVGDAILAVLPEDAGTPRADVVVANILAGPLVTLAEAIADTVAPGGRLALSGVLEDQADEVRAAYAARLSDCGIRRREGWVRLDFERADS